MNHTKLIEIYQSMSSQWLRRLDKFVQSSYFNESEFIIALHEYIRKNIENEEKLDKRTAYPTIFKSKKYNDTKMRYFMTRLYSLVEEFIYHESVIDTNDYQKQNILFEYFNKKKCTKAYNNFIYELNKKRQDLSPKENSIEFSKDKIFLNLFYEEGILMQDASKSLAQFKKQAPSHLSNIMSNLDNFYFINKLTYLCAIINNKNVINIDFDIKLKDEIIQLLQDKKFTAIPIVNVYSKILTMLENTEDTSHYYQLKEYLLKESKYFDKDELRNIFAYIQNYCIRKMNTGKSEFARELFDIYKLALEQKVFIQDDELSEVNYRNIVVTALRVSETKWTKDFIEKYKAMIAPASRENAYTFNLSSYYLYLKQYDKVLQLLREVVFTNVYYSNDYRIILLKTYYELDERDAANALLTSFRTYLKRKKIVTDAHRISNTNFIKFYKKISSTQRYSKSDLQVIKDYINNCKSISNKDWLLQKVDEKLFVIR